jgi:hypothetical protein
MLPGHAPPTTVAAPNANSITVFTGLCDALNQFQKNLVKKKLYSIADEYVIEFAPVNMAQATVALKGTTAYKSSPMADAKNPNAQLNPASNKLQNTARVISVEMGTQIVQFIDQIMRGSSFVTDQANVIYDEATGSPIPNPTVNNNTGFNWYKINFRATNLGWDDLRQEYAYRMTYIISQFSITDIKSQYFQPGAFLGTHKTFNYWFTGKNTQILDFESEYDNMYNLVIMSAEDSGAPASDGTPADNTPNLFGLKNTPITPTNNLPQIPRKFAAGASVSSQYADKGAALIGSSAADYLYSLGNQSNIKLKVIGDPAWLMQGEITNSTTPQNFTFAPFNADGTINFDAGQVLFDVIWNRPADYNFDTGLIDTNQQTRNADGSLALLQPQAHTVWVAQSVISTFSQGKFEQEIQGSAYLNNALAAAENEKLAREQAKKSFVDLRGGSTPRTPSRDFDTTEITQGTAGNPNPAVQAAVGPVVEKNLQPQAPIQPPKSNGDITPTLPRGQQAAAETLNNIFGNGLNQRTRAARLSTETQTMAPKDN